MRPAPTRRLRERPRSRAALRQSRTRPVSSGAWRPDRCTHHARKRPRPAAYGRNESTWQKENAMPASFDDEDPPVRDDEEPEDDGPDDPPGVRIDPDDPLLHDLRKVVFARRAEWRRLEASW